MIHIHLVSHTTANAPAGDIEWIFDFEWREKKDPGLGLLKGRARFISSLADIDDAEYLAQGWIESEGTEHFEFMVESIDNGWTSHQASKIFISSPYPVLTTNGREALGFRGD